MHTASAWQFNLPLSRMHKLPANATILEHELSQVRLSLERETGVLLDISDAQLSDLLTERVPTRAAKSTDDYIHALCNTESERERLAELLISGETRFFRYPAAFQAFTKLALPELEERWSHDNQRKLRIWSAGSSSGQEPYSIAISLCEALKCSKEAWNIQIIATDIRATALQAAERGLYCDSELQNMPLEMLQTYFARIGQHYLVKPRIRNLVTFTRANLTKPNYIGRFDCIFCMDVLPHFSAAQRSAVIEKMHMYLQPGGFLFLGQGEKLPATNVTLRWRQ